MALGGSSILFKVSASSCCLCQIYTKANVLLVLLLKYFCSLSLKLDSKKKFVKRSCNRVGWKMQITLQCVFIDDLEYIYILLCTYFQNK